MEIDTCHEITFVLNKVLNFSLVLFHFFSLSKLHKRQFSAEKKNNSFSIGTLNFSAPYWEIKCRKFQSKTPSLSTFTFCFDFLVKCFADKSLTISNTRSCLSRCFHYLNICHKTVTKSLSLEQKGEKNLHW